MNKNPRPAALELAVLLHAAHAAEAEVESRLNAIRLSLPKLLALKALSDAGESLPLSQLAERLSCVKSNITQLVDRLEAEGLVVRQAAAHDRRTRLAALTAAGRKACRDGMRVRQESERAMLARLSPGEARQLAVLLEKVGTPGV